MKLITIIGIAGSPNDFLLAPYVLKAYAYRDNYIRDNYIIDVENFSINNT